MNDALNKARYSTKAANVECLDGESAGRHQAPAENGYPPEPPEGEST
jgi:hypothetical protein